MKLQHYEDSKIDAVLSLFHKPATVAVIKNDNPFAQFTLHCDSIHCEESCRLYQHCYQKQANKLAALIISKSQELDFNQSMNEFQRILCP